MAPVRTHQELALADQLDTLRRRANILADIGVQLLHVVHGLGFILVEAEDLGRHEDVAAARLDRIGKVELALQIRIEQVIPR